VGSCCYRGSVVLKSEGFWNIVRLQSKMERGAFPGAAKRGLFKALALTGAAVDDVQSRGEYWNQVRWFSHPSKGLATSYLYIDLSLMSFLWVMPPHMVMTSLISV
jgi:hypothetical protein